MVTEVVFNPLGWDREDVVRAHVTLYGKVSPAPPADFLLHWQKNNRHHTIVHLAGVSTPLPLHTAGVPSLLGERYRNTESSERKPEPDAAQQALLDRLGLVIPERLGHPQWVRRPETMTEIWHFVCRTRPY